MVPVEQSKQLF